MPTISRGMFRWLFSGGATIEDMSDRLNHVWTVSLLLILAAVISWKQGVSGPIACWVPSQFTPSMAQYANSKCWNSYGIRYTGRDSKSTENIPFKDNWPEQKSPPYVSQTADEDMNTTYYQWIPIILVFQALLFKLPSILFYVLHSYSGISFTKLYGLTEGSQNLKLEDRVSLSKQIGRYIYGWCKTSFPVGVPWRLLTALTCLMKVLYCINIICQLAFLDRFLAPKFVTNATSYGEIINDNIVKNNATYWRESEAFPRTVFCGFPIRLLHTIQTWVVQCELPVNNFSERAYMLLWVWLVFVAVVTFLSFLVWAMQTIVPVFRKRYVAKFVEMHEECHDLSSADFQVQKFANTFLGEDGVIVLKLIAANSSELIVRDAVMQMLKMHVPDWSSKCTAPEAQTSPTEIRMGPIQAPAVTTDGAVTSQNTEPPSYPGIEDGNDKQKY